MLNGTDPLVADAHDDLDFDGVANGDEIRGGTAPSQADQQIYRDQRIVYGLDDLGLMDVPRPNNSDRTDERHCYDFDIQRIPLVVPPVPRHRGLNRILLYTSERPARVGGVTGETRVACFEAYYDGAKVKNPASGVIDVSQESLDDVRKRLSEAFDNLNSCPYFGHAAAAGADAGTADAGGADAGASAPEPLTRDDVEQMIQSCMPPKIALDRRLYPVDDLITMLESNLGSDLSPKLPQRAYQLFVPIQNFRANRDCYRPWEFDLLESFVEKMEAACAQCPAPQGTTSP